MTEAEYQASFFKKVALLLPDYNGKKCIIIKNDAGYLQGIPDWTVFYGKLYVTLEVKRTKDAHRQPNQSYYVSLFRHMAYSSFVYPENEQQVLSELKEYFKGETDYAME